MENAHNRHGPATGADCRINGNRGAPPGIKIFSRCKKPRDKVSRWAGLSISFFNLLPAIRLPAFNANRSRARTLWRRTLPVKPATGPVMGGLCPRGMSNFCFRIYATFTITISCRNELLTINDLLTAGAVEIAPWFYNKLNTKKLIAIS